VPLGSTEISKSSGRLAILQYAPTALAFKPESTATIKLNFYAWAL
jgi:hypothetical protein